MSYYDPYQGIPQPYVSQPYYAQYYEEQEKQRQFQQQQQQEQQQQQLHSYEQYAQYQSNFGLNEEDSSRYLLQQAHQGQLQQHHHHLFGEQQVDPDQVHLQNLLQQQQQQQQQQQNQQLHQHQHLHQQQQHQQHQLHHHDQLQDHVDLPYQNQLSHHHQQEQQQQLQQIQSQHQQQQQIQSQNPQSHHSPSQLNQQDQYHSYQDSIADESMNQQQQPVLSTSEFTSPAAPSRTVYLGNIPSDIQPNELLDYVRSGILESVKILPNKNCAFISFIDHQSALLFHLDCILKKLNIKGNDIRIGWGKNSSILPAVLELIQRDGATRNVYLGSLSNPITGGIITEAELRDDLSYYGVIDCIKIIPEKGIAFIHFLSILSAIRCVANLPLKEKYLEKKCFYGKDRCAFITKTQQHNAAQYLGLAPGMENIVTAADREFISSALVQQSAAAAQIATQAGGANNLGNRTVYLGNLHLDSTVEEICNVVRGGLLQSIRFLKERHVCFITFIDPIAAAQFFAMCQLHGLTIHNRRIKVGWGKHSGPLSNALSLAVSNGASRNIYVGNIVNFEFFNPNKLREDFSRFGDIEQINYLQEKTCAFINFVNIANAIKAIDGIKSYEDYKNLKINFGKDRCGNLPRQFQNQNQNNSHHQQHHQQQHQHNHQQQQQHHHHQHQQQHHQEQQQQQIQNQQEQLQDQEHFASQNNEFGTAYPVEDLLENGSENSQQLQHESVVDPPTVNEE